MYWKQILFRYAHIHTYKKERQAPAWERDALFLLTETGKLSCLKQFLIIPPIFAQMLKYP